GRTASAPYTRKNGVSPVARLHRRELLGPLPSPPMESVERPHFEAVEYGGVCTLVLIVTLGVRWRCIADLGAHLLTKLDKGRACELRAVVGDDAVGDAKSCEDTADELHGGCCGDAPDRLHLRPFGELVDGHKQIFVTSD